MSKWGTFHKASLLTINEYGQNDRNFRSAPGAPPRTLETFESAKKIAKAVAAEWGVDPSGVQVVRVAV